MNSNPRVLEYKYLYAELKNTKEQFAEGELDLNYRLSFFQRQIEESSSTSLKENFKKTSESINKTNHDKTKKGLIGKDDEDIINRPDHPAWVKKLYRKIISMIHPDKTGGLQIPHLINLYSEWYLITVEAYENTDYNNIIMIADNLALPIEKDIIDKNMQKGINEKKLIIHSIKSTLGYTWYHTSEKKRDADFKVILKQLGFDFTESEVQEVIKKNRPPKRGSQERPTKGVLSRERRVNVTNKNNPDS